MKGRQLRQIVVVVRCPGCHRTRDIRAGEVPAGEYPLCTTCALPLIPVRAVQR